MESLRFKISCKSVYWNGYENLKELDLSAVQEIKRKAEEGDVDSQYQLGLIYSDGKWLPRSSSNARMWFMKAAKKRKK